MKEVLRAAEDEEVHRKRRKQTREIKRIANEKQEKQQIENAGLPMVAEKEHSIIDAKSGEERIEGMILAMNSIILTRNCISHGHGSTWMGEEP